MDIFSSENILRFLLTFPILIISVTIHEFAHCWIDDRLGDDTARQQGRVTLNPLKHLDPLGTIMMVVSSLSGYGFGWGKPAPFNPANFRYPARDRMLGALAGPLSNILQMLAWASLVSLITHLGFAREFTHQLIIFCFYGIGINAFLALFNMIPVYPLDGHHVLSYLVPRSWVPVIDNPNWGYVFLAIVLIPQLNSLVLGQILSPASIFIAKISLLLVGLG